MIGEDGGEWEAVKGGGGFGATLPVGFGPAQTPGSEVQFPTRKTREFTPSAHAPIRRLKLHHERSCRKSPLEARPLTVTPH